MDTPNQMTWDWMRRWSSALQNRDATDVVCGQKGLLRAR
jgi:hypothetical protein